MNSRSPRRAYFGFAVLSVFAALVSFFAFFAFLCFFDFVPAVSDLVSVLAEVPVSVDEPAVPALPWANAPNETRQKAASAAAIVRIMLISLG